MKNIIILGVRSAGIQIADAIIGGASIYREHTFYTNFVKSEHKILGFLDDNFPIGSVFLGIPVLESFNDIQRRIDDGCLFAFSLLKVNDMKSRINLIKKMNIPDKQILSVIHHSVSMPKNYILEKGIFIGPNVTISPMVRIGEFSTIIAGSHIGGQSIIKDFVYIGANSTICGDCVIEKGTYIGPGSTISNNLCISKFSTIGIGSVLLESTKPDSTYFGNPARLRR